MTSDFDNSILNEVLAERERQDKKWGGVPGIDRLDDHTYAAVLGEEFGEVCQAWLQREVKELRLELIQVAAVAVAWIEEIDNGGAMQRALFRQPLASPDPELPLDLERVLRDPSIIVPQDQAVFEAVARWKNAPSDTASATPDPKEGTA